MAIESVTGFGEIQHNLILKWKKKKIVSMNLKKKEDISHYLYPCYISLKSKDMFPGKKKVRGLERHPDTLFFQFHEKCPHFSLFLIRH